MRAASLVRLALNLIAGLLLAQSLACGSEAGKASAQLINLASSQPAGGGWTQYVNPFIGTKPAPNTHYRLTLDTGDVFPGAAYPHGMLYWSPDTDDDAIPEEGAPPHFPLPGGYWWPQRFIKGFSITHFSGRGCQVYQDLPILPINGPFTRQTPPTPGLYDADLRQAFSHDNEIASPGYYRVSLDGGITVELTTTPRTGLGKFTFPPQEASTLLLSSAGNVQGGDADITIHPDRRLITGWALSVIGCPSGGYPIFRVYYAVEFDRPFLEYGTWHVSGTRVNPGSTHTTYGGVWLTFDSSGNNTILVKPAISYVSVENALLNLYAENPDWNFDRIANAADSAWNQKLSKIQVSGGSGDDLVVFYTALYHSFFHPNLFNDVNGEYIGFDDLIYRVPEGHNHYQMIPGWDQYRSWIRLFAMISPDEASDIIQSLVDDADQGGGGMPRWEQANRNSNGMIGDSPPAYVASAYAFGAKNFDTAAAFRALDLAASVPGTRSGGALVRDGLSNWLTQGYLPNKPSETLEYANDDFALAIFAQALGYTQRSRYYLNRSYNWKNTLNAATGYVEPRDASGNFPKDFDHGFWDEVNRYFAEGNSAQYTWMVPFDYQGLFDKIRASGQDPLARLDDFVAQINAGPNRPYVWIGNEPSLHSPWQYDFIGAPWRAQEVARRMELEAFLPTPEGLPGNDDAGSISSWYILAALGIYPEIPGVAGVVVGSPLFQEARMDLGNGHALRFIGRNASRETPYVQSLRVNGVTWESPWIDWALLANGGELEFELGEQPTSWGSDPAQAPPSWDGEPSLP